MRWKVDTKAKFKARTSRTIKRYALFPVLLDDKYRVWLEPYYERQVYYIFGSRGTWCKDKNWSESTEQKNMLAVIKG